MDWLKTKKTNGDRSDATAEEQLMMKQSCNSSFDNLEFQQPSNKRLKEIICVKPYWQYSRHAPRGFTHFSKAYREYKDNKNKTDDPELQSKFEKFDRNLVSEELDDPADNQKLVNLLAPESSSVGNSGAAAAVTFEDMHALELQAAAETAKTDQDRKIRQFISKYRSQKAIEIDTLNINYLIALKSFLSNTKTDTALVNLIDAEINGRHDATFLKMLVIFRKYLNSGKQALLLESINKYTKPQLLRLIELEKQSENNLGLIEHLQTALNPKGGRKSKRRQRRNRKTRRFF